MLPAPSLVSPAADARFSPGASITFDWTDVSGASDTVLPGETGYVVPVERPDLFAAAVLELLAEPDRVPVMGQRANEDVRALYDERVLLPAFADFWARTAVRGDRRQETGDRRRDGAGC